MKIFTILWNSLQFWNDCIVPAHPRKTNNKLIWNNVFFVFILEIYFLKRFKHQRNLNISDQTGLSYCLLLLLLLLLLLMLKSEIEFYPSKWNVNKTGWDRFKGCICVLVKCLLTWKDWQKMKGITFEYIVINNYF